MSLTNSVCSDTEAYALPRGGDENTRLKNQHPLFEDYAGGLIDASISKSDIHRVADIATGSGIWLAEVAKLLNNPTNVYYGFDIVASQFPENPGPQLGRFTMVEHDMTKPFPEQYHGQFDFVNVRLVVQALKEAEVKTAVSNIAALLRPGGHLQWQDLEWTDIAPYPPYPDYDDVRSVFKQHMKAYGLSECLPELVETSMQEVGFVEVNAKKSWHDSSSERAAGATTCVTTAMQSMLPKALATSLRSEGSSVDEATFQRVLKQLMQNLESLVLSGHNMKLSATKVMGSKD
ncbi:hypothetical protein N7494_004734 [Penicillium frequentans]|uniref:Methyltransferase type 12 domain-containing protein n=1 Tax=Penicillium frequentans TaxID=3151616 RepID=A0AAD6D2B1_9EURO|nr:hypothetical protein N7494_004734 [Penicillium glabrum]